MAELEIFAGGFLTGVALFLVFLHMRSLRITDTDRLEHLLTVLARGGGEIIFRNPKPSRADIDKEMADKGLAQYWREADDLEEDDAKA